MWLRKLIANIHRGLSLARYARMTHRSSIAIEGAIYLELVDTTFDPCTNDLLENLVKTEVWVIHQDSASSHYAVPVRQFLNDLFPGRRIGRHGPIEWTTRSPDLSPLNYFLRERILHSWPRS